MKKSVFLRLIALCLTMALLLCPFTAAATVAKEDALAAARKEIPSSCKLRESEWDKNDKEWEFEFRTKDKKTDYDVTVNGETGAVKKVEMDVRKPGKAKKYSITEKAAKKAVTRQFSGATIKKVKKATDDGRKVYKITFKADGYKGSAEVNGKSGKLTEWEKIYT